MAIEKPVETESGVEVENAYWTPAHYHMDIIGRGGNIIFYAHASKAAHAAGKTPLPGIRKDYPFTTEQFQAATVRHLNTLFPDWGGIKLADLISEDEIGEATVADVMARIPAGPAMPILYNVLGRFIYGHAKTFKDTPVLDTEGKPVLGPDEPVLDTEGKPVLKPGPPLMRSFFEGAQDV